MVSGPEGHDEGAEAEVHHEERQVVGAVVVEDEGGDEQEGVEEEVVEHEVVEESSLKIPKSTGQSEFST